MSLKKRETKGPAEVTSHGLALDHEFGPFISNTGAYVLSKDSHYPTNCMINSGITL